MSEFPTTASLGRQAKGTVRAGRKVTIGRCIIGEFGDREAAPKVYPRHAIALREIETLLRDRRRRRPIGEEELATFLRIAAPRLVADGGDAASLDQALAWARVMTPELGQDRARRILERYGSNSPYKARSAGDLLQVEREERDRLRLTKIRYAGQTDQKLAADNREKARLRMQALRSERRLASGKPATGPSLTALAPWDELGISRRTWERRRARGEVAAPSVSQGCSEHIPSEGREDIQVRTSVATRRNVGRSEGSPQAIPDAPRAVLVVPSSAGPIAGRARGALDARSTFSGEVAA